MNPTKVNEVMQKLREGWRKKQSKGAKLDYIFLKAIRKLLVMCPDEDGKKRVKDLETGKTHLVPIEEMMLNGLKQQDLKNYPIEPSEN